ncbi:hypothetical protein JCM8208_004775 [Rhodotorula glutinis]
MNAKGMLWAHDGADGVGRTASSGLSPLQIVGRAAVSEQSKLLLRVLLLFANPKTSEERLAFEGDAETLEWARRVVRSVDGGRGSSASTARHLLQLEDRPAVAAWLETHLPPSPPSAPGPPVPPPDAPPSHPPTSSDVLISRSVSLDSTQHDGAASHIVPLLEVKPSPALEPVNLLACLARPAPSLDRPSSMQTEIRLACEELEESHGADEGAQGSSGATFSSVGRTDGGERVRDLAVDSADHADTASPAPTPSPPPPFVPPARDYDASTLSSAVDDSPRVKLEECGSTRDGDYDAHGDEPKIKVEKRSPSPAGSLSDMDLESSQEQEREEETPIEVYSEEEEVDVKPFAVVERTDRPSPEQPPSLLERVAGPVSSSESSGPVGLGITGVALNPTTSRIPRLAIPPPPPPPPAPRSASPPNPPAPVVAHSPILPPARPASPRRKPSGADASGSANQVPLGPLARWKHYPTPEFSPPPRLALPPAPPPLPAAPLSPAVPAGRARLASPPLVNVATTAEPEPEWVNPFAGPFGRVRYIEEDPPPARQATTAAAPRSSLKRRSSTGDTAPARAQMRRLGVRWAEPETWVVGSGAGPVVEEGRARASR